MASVLFAALPPAQAAQWWAGCTQAGGTAGQCTGYDVHIGEWQGPFHCWHATNSCSYGIIATDCWVRGGRPVTCERCEGDLLPWNFDTALDLLQASAGLRMHACTNELRSDTGWGATIRSLCSLGSPTSTQYQLGIPIIEHRQVYFGGTRTLETGCKEGWSLGVDLSRQREIRVRCPPGYEDLGYGVCVRPVDDTCPVGNPVAPGSGSKLHTEVDFEVDAHPLLRLQRTYNSGGFYVPIGEYPQDANAGQLGFYWRTNFDLRLWRNDVSSIPIQAQRADGRVVSFDAFGEELQKINGRAALRLESLTDASGNPVGWRLLDEGDRIETYNAAGRLVRIENKDGQFVDLAYDEGRLRAVTDERGRSITFDYLHGRLNAAHFPDGQVAWYRFDEKKRLIEVRFGSDGMRAYRYEHPTRQHLLTGIVDERGVLVASYEYDERGRVVRSLNAPGVADGTINRRTYSYASNGDVTMVDPLGTPTTFVMTTQKGVRRVASFSQPCPTCGGSSQQQRTYDARGYLVQVTDFRGVVRSFQRDELGREVLVTEVANGLPGMPACPASLPNCEEARQSTRTMWSPVWNVPVKRERLDAQGAVVSIWQQALNERGQITARCEYDPAQDAATRYECGTQANAPEGVRQTRWIYCNAADGSAPDPIGDVAEDLQKGCPHPGLVRRIDGPRTDVDDWTTIEYYTESDAGCGTGGECRFRAGDVRRIVNALGHETVYLAYDGAGRWLRSRDANGVITDRTYHARGWLASFTIRANADGSPSTEDATTRIEYSPTGKVVAVTDPDGVRMRYAYDEADRLVRICDGTGNARCTRGNRIEYTLDAAGNRVVERVFDRTNTLRRRLARQFDALGRLDRARDALDASGQPLAGEALGDPQQERVTADFEYDANGNRIGEVDGRGVRGRQVYDPLNRLIATIQDYGGTDPDTADATTRFGYDALDHLRTVTDPNGLVTRYEYDGLGNQTALISPDTGITRLTHDAAGNVLGRTDARGITARMEYDALNRLLAVRYPDPGQDQRYEYDAVAADCPAHGVFAKGRLTGFADESGSTRLCYDHRGRVVRKVQVTGNRSLRVSYSYSRSGRLRVVKYPSGLSVRYRYDATGRVKQVDWRPRGSGDWQPLLTEVVWLPFGPVEELHFPQRTQRREYDLNYGIAAIDAVGGLSLGFELDVQGNPVAVASPRGGPVVAEYRYDALQRLREVVLGGEVEERYRYDRTGNRMSEELGGGEPVVYRYAADSHRLQEVGTHRYGYDANGNLVEGIVRGVGGTLEVGAHNRPRGWRLPNGSGQWRHNARGERVWLEARGGVGGVARMRERIVHDESGRRLETRRLQPDSVQSLIWLDPLPVAVVQDGVVHAIEADHLGTPRLATHLDTGEVSWRWDFFGSAFGGHAAENRGLDLALRFPGQYHDPATGLHYNYFRDYDPSTGRYVQSDPIGLDGGINTYLYVFANTLSGIDPLGLFNVTAREIYDGSGYFWQYKFTFRDCKSELLLKLAESVAGRFIGRGGRWLNVIIDIMEPGPAGDVDIEDLARRCKCMTYDPALEALFKTNFGNPDSYFSEEVAYRALGVMRRELAKLRRSECNQCASDHFYDWDMVLEKARMRGTQSLHRRVREW